MWKFIWAADGCGFTKFYLWRCYTWFVQLISINYVSIFSQKGIFMISDRLLCTYLWHFHGYLQCMAVSPMKEWMSPDNHQHALSAAQHISDHLPVQNLQEKTEAWPSWPVVHLSFGNMINVDDIFFKTPSWRYKNNDWWNASVSYGDCKNWVSSWDRRSQTVWSDITSIPAGGPTKLPPFQVSDRKSVV